MSTDLENILNPVIQWLLSILGSGEFWLGVAVPTAFLVGHAILNKNKYQISSVGLNLPFGLGNITYDATGQDRVLAWKLYVQLKTRKAALPFDEKNDVIIEIYESLYELFPIIRELLSSIPIAEAERPHNLADLILRVQNDGLRPHLTQWQAAFRQWWERAIKAPENEDKLPQEIQKQFPKYIELVEDLKKMNSEMSKYAEDLLAIVKSPKRSVWQIFGKRERTPEPVAPEPPLDGENIGDHAEVKATQ